MNLISLILISINLVTGQDQYWLNECLNAHNDFRALREKPPLILNTNITEIAQSWAQHLSETCTLHHSNNTDYGENIAAGYLNCTASVKQWIDEEEKYHPCFPGFSLETGHYTQVVWKSTTDLGCGMATHCKYRHVTVCNYWPPGNYEGEFPKNV